MVMTPWLLYFCSSNHHHTNPTEAEAKAEAVMEAAMENTTFAQIGSLSCKYPRQLLQENPVECFGGY